MEAPGGYFGFDKFDTGSAARDAYQISTEWSDARLRGTFDTLQLEGDFSVPLENGGLGPNPEPLTTSYPEYGTGNRPQLITPQRLQFDKVDLLPEK
jgi:hypothetical protein